MVRCLGHTLVMKGTTRARHRSLPRPNRLSAPDAGLYQAKSRGNHQIVYGLSEHSGLLAA